MKLHASKTVSNNVERVRRLYVTRTVVVRIIEFLFVARNFGKSVTRLTDF